MLANFLPPRLSELGYSTLVHSFRGAISRKFFLPLLASNELSLVRIVNLSEKCCEAMLGIVADTQTCTQVIELSECPLQKN